jgi:hypothetical protein
MQGGQLLLLGRLVARAHETHQGDTHPLRVVEEALIHDAEEGVEDGGIGLREGREVSAPITRYYWHEPAP